MKTKQKIYTLNKVSSNIKLVLFFFISNILFTYAQTTCDVTMSVLKDRNSRSTTIDGTFYKMIITNKTNSNDLYHLSSLNNNTTCSNIDSSSNSSNVNLIVSFKDLNLNDINSISVPAKETIEFYVHVNVPVGTLINKWCCSKIIAKSNTCNSYSVSSQLHTFVINANE